MTGKFPGSAHGWQSYQLYVAIVLKSWSLSLLEASRRVQTCKRVILPLHLPFLTNFKLLRKHKRLILLPLLCSTKKGCHHTCCRWSTSFRWSCPNFRYSWALLWSCLARRCLDSASTGFSKKLPRFCTTTFRCTRYRLPTVFSAVLCDPLMIHRRSVDQPVPYLFSKLARKYHHTSLNIEALMQRRGNRYKFLCPKCIVKYIRTLW